jgi:hypothetical protein
MAILAGAVVVLSAGDHNQGLRIDAASKNNAERSSDLFAPTTPDEYARGIGALSQFELAIETRETDRCLESLGVKVVRAPATQEYAYAPGFESPELMQAVGFRSVAEPSVPVISPSTPAEVEQGAIDDCSRRGEAASAGLRKLVSRPINAWMENAVLFDHSAAMADAVRDWRICMAQGGADMEWPEDVYRLADPLGPNSPGVQSLASAFGRCLPSLNRARDVVRRAGRDRLLASQDLDALQRKLSSEVRRLSIAYEVPVPESLRGLGV